MNINKMLKGAVAALTSAAALGALTAPAFAASGTYDLNGKGVDALSVHGGAQRIATIGNAKAKNVILFIGDGMGDSEITVARNYLHGVNGTFQGLDKIGQPGALQTSTGKAAESGVGQYTTFSLGGSSNDSLMAKDSKGQLTGSKTAGVITPVTDSSASGSGWATGTKTYNNAVSVDVKGNPQLNLIELAKANGLATGNVTTSEIQDATPAGSRNPTPPSAPATARRASGTAPTRTATARSISKTPSSPASAGASPTSSRPTVASAPSPSSCSTRAPT